MNKNNEYLILKLIKNEVQLLLKDTQTLCGQIINAELIV